MKRERKKAPNRLPTQFNSVQPQPQLKCASNNSINIQLNEANESGETIINDNSSQFWLNSHVDRQRVHIEFIKMVETVRLWALTHTGNEQWDEVRARARSYAHLHAYSAHTTEYLFHAHLCTCVRDQIHAIHFINIWHSAKVFVTSPVWCSIIAIKLLSQPIWREQEREREEIACCLKTSLAVLLHPECNPFDRSVLFYLF